MVVLYAYLVSLVLAPQLWLGGLTGLPIDYFLYPAWLVALLLGRKLPLLFRLTLLDKILLVLVGWIVLGSIVNGMTDASITYSTAYIKMFVLYKLTSATLSTVTEVRRVLHFFVVLSLLLAVEAIQHKFGKSGIGWAGQSLGWIDPSVLRAGGNGRAKWVGIFDGPGVFCVIFTIALGVVMPYLDRENPARVKLAAAGAFIVLAVATYATGSRGGLLATLAIVALYILIRGKISFRSGAIGGAIVVVAFLLAPPWMTQMRDESNSAQHRVEMWAEGLDMVKENPLFGIGRGNFRGYTGALVAHNSAIEIAGETGFPGILLWLSMLLVSFKATIGAWREKAIAGAPPAVGYGLTLALMGYLVSAMFVTLEYETMYFMIALCAALGRQSDPAPALTRKNLTVLSCSIVGGLVFLQYFVLAYMS